MNRLLRLLSGLIGFPWRQFSIKDLGTLGGSTSIGLAINSAGNVSGVSYLTAHAHGGGVHAFCYSDGTGMVDLGVLPPGNLSWGYGINDSGLIVGGSFTTDVPHAFVTNSALVLADLGALGGDYSFAYDINNRGSITGEAENAAADSHAFVWKSGNMSDIGTLGGDESVGRSINESGQVAGQSTIGGGARSPRLAFRFTEGRGMISLGTLPGGTNSAGYGINNSGQVVGTSDTGPIFQPGVGSRNLQYFSFFGTHAFLWTEGGGMRDLGHLGGGTSGAAAINNHGVVVGGSTLIDGSSRAFRWTPAGGMVDLNSLLPPFSGWVLVEAHGINDRGQITGAGLRNGALHAYRLDPPEPLVNAPP